MKWEIIILNKKVEKEINSLPNDLKAKLSHIISLIREFGAENVREPYIKYLKTHKLWEIRMKGKSGIGRAIYITSKAKKIYILHAFVKKSQKTPADALKKAINRISEVKND